MEKLTIEEFLEMVRVVNKRMEENEKEELNEWGKK
jgi:hypothetical protein